MKSAIGRYFLRHNVKMDGVTIEYIDDAPKLQPSQNLLEQLHDM